MSHDMSQYSVAVKIVWVCVAFKILTRLSRLKWMWWGQKGTLCARCQKNKDQRGSDDNTYSGSVFSISGYVLLYQCQKAFVYISASVFDNLNKYIFYTKPL